jgi:hypothetical protein
VFDNWVLRRILGLRREEMGGGRRRLHNEELHNLHTSPNVINVIRSRRMRWVGQVARLEKRNACNTFVGEPEGKRPLGRTGRRWKDNIRMDLREIGRDGVY